MSAEASRTFADWLRLREPADAAARASELLEPVRRRLAGGGRTVIHDFGSGTGSMGRWLAPRLAGPQHWIMYDRDADLLERAAADMVDTAADGAPVTVETRRRDITRLTPADLDGASLVTASALLDMLTADEIERVVAACAGAGCPALLMISVIGRVQLTPADPLDAEIAAAFNDHQRRTVDGRTLLGPDAADACAAAFTRHGVDVDVRSSPWRLGPEQADLIAEWLTGWVDAACEQRPELAGPAAPYARRRRAEAAAGRLRVVVDHHDLLAGAG
ncbi:Methyltransferase domain-containing protein [Micromonospora pattaloongensis]|uniref:Methyltransferase domain-containing protein n=1 Tax=Micromonospora pattaloongensis TaxID=405436 RepID=A0A1H3JKP1_9ACTN|nr:class I SAM-dependent methyltransferase [Micromonospora pattaloongensis]SDY39978.1 Methyltransferase domain-containing protein [Micromonospora pattaloongensis]